MFRRPVSIAVLAPLAIVLCLADARTVLAQNGRITGVVRDETGGPIRGASVRAENGATFPRSLTGTTDERGRFSFYVERSGNWTFYIDAPGFAPAEASGRVRLGPNPEIQIELERREAPELTGTLAGINSKALFEELTGAESLYASGKYAEAVRAYEAIAAKVPALSTIHLQIGNAYRQQKAFDRAQAAYERVLAANSANPAALYNIGEVKLAASRPDEAAEWYAKAAAADRAWGEPLLKLAMIARDKGDREGAIRYLQQVVSSDPESPEATQATTLIGQLTRGSQ